MTISEAQRGCRNRNQRKIHGGQCLLAGEAWACPYSGRQLCVGAAQAEGLTNWGEAGCGLVGPQEAPGVAERLLNRFPECHGHRWDEETGGMPKDKIPLYLPHACCKSVQIFKASLNAAAQVSVLPAAGGKEHGGMLLRQDGRILL